MIKDTTMIATIDINSQRMNKILTSYYGRSSSPDGRYYIASYDQQRDDDSYDKIPYKLLETKSNYSTKDKKYEYRTDPLEGLFLSSF